MEKYLQQLLKDIEYAKENVSSPYANNPTQIGDWISEEEEEKTAPRIQLEAWTGIQQEQLPPANLLTNEQIEIIYKALEDMLQAYNYAATFIFCSPTRMRYQVVRKHFRQMAIQKRWHYGFFDLCFAKKAHPNCLMDEFCHCAYFEELRKNWVEEDLTPEEERAKELEYEITYLKKKHGSDWMKYYPYHLDPDYDDENGNPYNYGFGDFEEDDDWWRK